MKKNNVIIDTNVFMDDPNILNRLKNYTIIMPVSIARELDKFKSGVGTTTRNVRETIRILESVRIQQNTKIDIKFIDDKEYLENHESYADPYILAVAKKHNAKIITNDISLRIQASCNGIQSESYKLDKINIKNLEYKGFSLHKTDYPLKKDIKHFLNKNSNHYFICSKGKEKDVIYRNEGEDLLPIKNNTYKNISGISANNNEQKIALNMLLDPSIDLVCLEGLAGTGKTLLALAASLHLIKNKVYDSISVGRAIIPLGKDLGALPGTAEDKVKPYLAPIYDNLEIISLAQGELNTMGFIQELEESHKLKIQPTALLRGKTFNKTILVIDEAQNLTPHEATTILTRAGKGCKIILLGDTNQIDVPTLDKNNNGLSFVIDGFLKEKPDCFGTLKLEKVERSKLANIAIKALKI